MISASMTDTNTAAKAGSTQRAEARWVAGVTTYSPLHMIHPPVARQEGKSTTAPKEEEVIPGYRPYSFRLPLPHLNWDACVGTGADVCRAEGVLGYRDTQLVAHKDRQELLACPTVADNTLDI